MKLTINVEFELVKERVYDDDIEVIAEYTYVVSGEWLSEIYKKICREMAGVMKQEQFAYEYNDNLIIFKI